MAAFAGAFNSDEADKAEEEHDYSDNDSERYYIHVVLPIVIFLLFFNSFLIFIFLAFFSESPKRGI